jgi:excisionase family DNA binding protein
VPTSTLPLWTAREAADFLNVRLTRIYELVHARQIPFTKVGPRQLRFDPALIREWLENHTTGTGGTRAPADVLAQRER